MCGVIGVIQPQTNMNAAYQAYQGLLTLQHRGQDAAGILSYDFKEQRFFQKKDRGLVSQVFQENISSTLPGSMAIGHNRYATVGHEDDLQPLMTGFPLGVAMAHNGNLVNYHSMANKIREELKLHLLTGNDLELILQLWCYHLLNDHSSPSCFDFERGYEAIAKVAQEVEGGYALVGMVAGEGLVAFRDPQGIRPLVIGRKRLEDGSDSYCICSETVAINFLGYEYLRSVQPGEFIFIHREKGFQSKIVRTEKSNAHCMFEWVYFSGAESKLDDRYVYTGRLKLGHQLAIKARRLMERGEISPDIVAPIPDTSRTAAISLAEMLNLPYREVLIKNRYCQRSFILNSKEKREKTVKLKLSPVCSEIEGKNIMLVDDSIVRGTTSQKIVSLLKGYGAKEISLAITCPPIRYPCYYGIDFPTRDELIASRKDETEIEASIGAKKVIYLDEKDLREAIGIKDICMACIDNRYPTPVKDGFIFSSLRQQDREKESR